MDPVLFLKALAFAAEKHRHQRRKDAKASPYINHPISVAAVLATEGGVTDETTLVAAILHDTVEDTETTFDELTKLFGADIAELVAELTDDKKLHKEERKRLQVVHAPHCSERAKLLKIADKICNVRDVAVSPPVYWSEQRRQQYLSWATEVIAGCRGVNSALEAAFDKSVALARRNLGIQRN